MTSVFNSGTDHVGIVGVQYNTSQGTSYTLQFFITYGTFTGFHRVLLKMKILIKKTLKKLKMFMLVE